MNQYIMHVSDILQSKHFQSAKVVAGNAGLHRVIKWVHIIEILNVENFLKGNELVLTTGIGFQKNPNDFIRFVKGLIQAKCAGLCIELGNYIQEIPEEVMKLADEYEFPIIVFEKEVAFIEITQDIHSSIINQQYSMVSKLESFSELLNKETLYAQLPEEILKITYQYVGVPIILKLNEQDPIVLPNLLKAQKANLLDKIEFNKDKFPIQPIHLFEHQYGEVLLFKEVDEITEFETLILDRTATALGQLFIRKLYVEEKRGLEDAQWIEEWIEGKHSKEEIHQYIYSQWSHFEPKGAAVLVLHYNEEGTKQKLDITYLKLLCRSILEQYGFQSLVYKKKNYIIFILLNKRDGHDVKERIGEAINKIQASDIFMKIEPSMLKIAVGKIMKDLSLVHESYQTALDTLYIKRKVGTTTQFYEDLHLFRLIYNLQKHINLEELVVDYLQPIIEFDEKNNGQLLETLEVYLQTNGSKQETARRLYIVRQTLYHRLKRIESLIGEDFMDGEKRLALEFMLLARKFMTA